MELSDVVHSLEFTVVWVLWPLFLSEAREPARLPLAGYSQQPDIHIMSMTNQHIERDLAALR